MATATHYEENDIGRVGTRSKSDELLTIVIKIAIVHFVIEAIIMFMLSGWDFDLKVVSEGVLDASLLTAGSTPFIYFWVARPFARAAQQARAVLSHELGLRSQQAEQLAATLEAAKVLLNQNDVLRANLERVNQEATTANERLLQRIGADLHDGPAQILTYCRMVMDQLNKSVERIGNDRDRKVYNDVREGLSNALRDVRSISTGLLLPELGSRSPEEFISLVVRQHEERTNTVVRTTFYDLPPDLPDALKICIYRIVQEALWNAYRHGGGKGQRVDVKGSSTLTVAISDSGPGFSPDCIGRGGLGLVGMQVRVHALGGELEIDTGHQKGTRILATFNLTAMSQSRPM